MRLLVRSALSLSEMPVHDITRPAHPRRFSTQGMGDSDLFMPYGAGGSTASLAMSNFLEPMQFDKDDPFAELSRQMQRQLSDDATHHLSPRAVGTPPLTPRTIERETEAVAVHEAAELEAMERKTKFQGMMSNLQALTQQAESSLGVTREAADDDARSPTARPPSVRPEPVRLEAAAAAPAVAGDPYDELTALYGGGCVHFRYFGHISRTAETNFVRKN
jgi:hypothetical protein